MQRWIRTLTIVGTAMLILSGCSKQTSESASAPPDSGTALQPVAPRASNAEPSEPKSAHDAPTLPEYPEDFPEDVPLPVYAQFQVKNRVQVAAGDSRGVQLEIIGEAAPQSVAAFYEAEFRKRGLKVSTTAQRSEEGEELLVLGLSASVTAGVAVTK
ncbi:MAG: hypothetical protein ACK4UU_08975, partial [Fimbriimonadales bacterium]